MVVAAMAPACAKRTASTPFVRKNAAFVALGGQRSTAQAPAVEAVERAVREAEAGRTSLRPAQPPMIEGRDERLRTALALLSRSRSEAAHLRVAAEYVRVGVLDVAYDHFSEAVRLNPRSARALDGRARLLRDAGLLGPALVDANRARYFEPASAESRNTLGTILERLGQCREAVAAYHEAMKLSQGADWATANARRLSAHCPG